MSLRPSAAPARSRAPAESKAVPSSSTQSFSVLAADGCLGAVGVT